jgi:hypothetical protein
MAAKTPTQRNISAVLANARHVKSVSSPSRIRGLRNHSDGYAVTAGSRRGTVIVRHEVVSIRPLPRDVERIAAMTAVYAEEIAAAGFAVERQGDHLIVTAKTED